MVKETWIPIWVEYLDLGFIYFFEIPFFFKLKKGSLRRWGEHVTSGLLLRHQRTQGKDHEKKLSHTHFRPRVQMPKGQGRSSLNLAQSDKQVDCQLKLVDMQGEVFRYPLHESSSWRQHPDWLGSFEILATWSMVSDCNNKIKILQHTFKRFLKRWLVHQREKNRLLSVGKIHLLYLNYCVWGISCHCLQILARVMIFFETRD